MINHWTVFEGMQNGRRSERVRVTLNKHRTMVLNQVAYQGIGAPKAVELMFEGYVNLGNMAAAENRRILNSTPGGFLDVFERVEFSSLFQETKDYRS